MKAPDVEADATSVKKYGFSTLIGFKRSSVYILSHFIFLKAKLFCAIFFLFPPNRFQATFIKGKV